jgi:hypothetical protein
MDEKQMLLMHGSGHCETMRSDLNDSTHLAVVGGINHRTEDDVGGRVRQ